jgi:hypothetical protein
MTSGKPTPALCFAIYLSDGAVAKKPRFDRSTIQSDSFDCLRISRHQVNGLVAPPNFIALDVKDDAFDGTLGAQHDRFAIPNWRNFEAQVLYVREMYILEWLWPVSVPAREPKVTPVYCPQTHQFEYRPKTTRSSSSSRAPTTIVFGTSLSRVRTGWPGTCPFQSSVLELGARVTPISHRLLHSGRSRSKNVTCSVACFFSSVPLLPQISSCDVIVK